ncbi:lytic murein transglycosylase [Kitasatospora sp. NPDC094011]|uniref:lytic transglycosylase domain-containing protein n=1 Tax=Kitasatospora sp. NPDC094011 TaxID=3364090 RepID=UPI003803EBAC
MAAKFGSANGGRKVRIGKRVTGTAAALAALAALTGSQVPGLGLAQVAAADAGPAQDAAAQAAGSSSAPLGGASTGIPGTGNPADGGGTVPLPQPPGAQTGLPPAGPFAATGASLPTTVFAAYRQAETRLAQRSPGCHLPWQLLAAIGQVESGQANGGQVDASGKTLTPILGPVLDGSQGFAAIPDTDGGRYDGDARWDRAVGPMQFIPSTWAAWGVDATGKGSADPNNIFDAAETAGRYLCADGRDLSVPSQLDQAVLSYNHSAEYLRTVRNWMAHYGSGQVSTVADRPGVPTLPGSSPSPFLRPSDPTGSTGGTGGTPSGNGGTGTGPTPSVQPTEPAVTPTPTPTAQPTDTPTPTPTPTSSGSPSPSASPTATPSTTPTPTGSPSPTATPTGTPSGTPTSCPSPTATATPGGTASPSPSASPTATPSSTPTGAPGGSPSATPTDPACPTPTPSGTPSPTAGPTATTGTTATPSASLSPSPSATVKK